MKNQKNPPNHKQTKKAHQGFFSLAILCCLTFLDKYKSLLFVSSRVLAL